jgi:hypothetical protein
VFFSATYICPVRGLAEHKAPDPERLYQSARVAKGLGIERLLLPVLEESLLGTGREMVTFLDEIITSLDKINDAGVAALFVAPAQRILGLDWVPPYLVRGSQDPKADPVFVDGRLRNLRPFGWWKDLSIIQKRLRVFRELVVATIGHPAITGWLIMDRALSWSRPDKKVAELILKSYLAEIRERDENIEVTLSFEWPEFLQPDMAKVLAVQVNGVRMGGLDIRPVELEGSAGPSGKLLAASYLGALGQWLFDKPVIVETRLDIMDKTQAPEEIAAGFKRMALQGLAGINWTTLVDPAPHIYDQPPWSLQQDLKHAGMLDQRLKPKRGMEFWVNEMRSTKVKDGSYAFVDISQTQYMKSPDTHFHRLWEHFRESAT